MVRFCFVSVGFSVVVASAADLANVSSISMIPANATLEDRVWEDKTSCVPPSNAVKGEWQYNDFARERFIGCTDKHDDNGYWIMLNSYRSGGKQGVHWKYVTDGRYGDCLGGYGGNDGWIYYDKSGTKVIAKVTGYTTMVRDTKPWCAMRTYRKGGVMGNQWTYCDRCPPKQNN